jgi:hypothetical protein
MVSRDNASLYMAAMYLSWSNQPFHTQVIFATDIRGSYLFCWKLLCDLSQTACPVVHEPLIRRLCSGTGVVAFTKVNDSASRPGICLPSPRNSTTAGILYILRR